MTSCSSITEDDVSEIRQDINKFRYEMIDILRKNNFETPAVPVSDVFVGNKRSKQTERRIMKGFNITSVDSVLKEAFANQKETKTQDFFKVIAKAIGNSWNSASLALSRWSTKPAHIAKTRLILFALEPTKWSSLRSIWLPRVPRPTARSRDSANKCTKNRRSFQGVAGRLMH